MKIIPLARNLALVTAVSAAFTACKDNPTVPKLNNILHGLGTCVVTVGPCP